MSIIIKCDMRDRNIDLTFSFTSSFQKGHPKEDIHEKTVNQVSIRGRVHEIKAIILGKTAVNS